MACSQPRCRQHVHCQPAEAGSVHVEAMVIVGGPAGGSGGGSGGGEGGGGEGGGEGGGGEGEGGEGLGEMEAPHAVPKAVPHAQTPAWQSSVPGWGWAGVEGEGAARAVWPYVPSVCVGGGKGQGEGSVEGACVVPSHGIPGHECGSQSSVAMSGHVMDPVKPAGAATVAPSDGHVSQVVSPLACRMATSSLPAAQRVWWQRWLAEVGTYKFWSSELSKHCEPAPYTCSTHSAAI